MKGVWRADSGVTGGGKRVAQMDAVKWEVLQDGSFYITDPESFLFPESFSGQLEVREEGLVYNPEGDGMVLQVSVRLTRLGTHLEIQDESREKTLYFNKQRIVTGETDLLVFYNKRPTLWELKGWRGLSLAPGRPDTSREFYYLRFVQDTVRVLAYIGGLVTERTETWSLQKDTLSWGASGIYHVDYVTTDSLRLWPHTHDSLLTPLNASREPDYLILKKVSGFHPDYRDLNFLMGYWRSDVWRDSQSHYGRYYDLELAPGGNVTTITNLNGQPDITAWEYTGGSLSLMDSGGNSVAATLETSEPGRMQLSTSLGSGQFTQMDPQLFASDPLKRFDDRSYMHLNLGSETLRFYFDQTYHVSGDFEKVGMAAGESGDSLYVFWTSHPGTSESRLVTSKDPGFAFAIAVKDTGAAYRWLYADTASGTEHLLSIRSQVIGSASVVEGTLSSGQIVDADGSVYQVTGQFRYRRSAPEPQNTLWNQVPTVR